MTDYDQKEIYCRKLGHQLTFLYCRKESGSLPCSRIRDCWFERIPIDQFLEKHFSEEERARVLSSAKPKTRTLFELIEEAQKRSENPPE